MPKFEDMFGATPYQVGPMSPSVLDEMEREKKRKKLRETLKNKRVIKIQEKTKDRAPELSDEMLGANSQQEASAVPEMVQTQMAPSPASQGMMPLPRDMMPQATEPDYRLNYGKAPEYNLGMDQEDYPMPVNQPFKGGLPSGNDRPDSRQMLYDYLKNRRESEPEFQNEYKDLSNQAETGRVLNTFASGLGEMASMAGTLGGKRSDTGDMKALPNAIYGGMRKQADETLGLRRLANQEQVSDIRLLRDLERGDLDALRTQKILADLNRQKQVPKTLPYFVPGDGKTPPKMVMMRNDGTVEYKDLPPGAIPTNESYTLGQPVYGQQGEVVYPQTSKRGETRFIEAPKGSRTGEQLKIESQQEVKSAEIELKRLQNEFNQANASQKLEIEKRIFDLKKAMDEYNMAKGNRSGDQADRRLDIMEDKNNQDKNDGSKTSEGERKSALFSTVLLDSLKKIEDMENGNPELGVKPYRPGVRSTAGNMFGGSGSVLGNRVLGDEDRAYDTLANTLIEPILRSWTGAAAQKDEIKREWSKSKILPGDDEKTIKLKQNARRVYARGLVEASGRAKGSIESSQSSGGSSGGAGRVVAEKKYSPSRNKTKITYSDGSTETVEGRQ